MDRIENNSHRIQKINGVLSGVGILDFLQNSKELYCGGSLPMLAFSKKTTVESIMDMVGDVDIYTCNIAQTMNNLNKRYGNKIQNSVWRLGLLQPVVL